MISVYLAARYSRREELCGYREELRNLGFEVTSRWLDGAHQISPEGLALGADNEALVDGGSESETVVAMRQRFAIEDYLDLTRSELIVNFTEPQYSTASRGGRHVEFGVALATPLACIVCGPRENVFHCMPGVVVRPDWPETLDLLRALRVSRPNHLSVIYALAAIAFTGAAA